MTYGDPFTPEEVLTKKQKTENEDLEQVNALRDDITIQWLQYRYGYIENDRAIEEIVSEVNRMIRKLHGNFRNGLIVATLIYLERFSSREAIRNEVDLLGTYLMSYNGSKVLIRLDLDEF